MMKTKEALTGFIVVGNLIKGVKKFGNTCQVLVPRKFDGCQAEIRFRKKWIICRRCHETFINPENISEDERYCTGCFAAIKFIEDHPDLKCKTCGKKITQEEYKLSWDRPICESCWIKEAEVLK